MEIKRDFYLNKLISRKSNGLVKVITGIRRCGKSYLLNTIFYHYLAENGVDESHIIRFAFDSADDLYLIGESLIKIQKEKRRVDPEIHGIYTHLLNILSSSVGSLTNPEKLKNTFRTVKKSKITANTVRKYLAYFEDFFLIESAMRYDIKGKAYIETTKKYYFSDLGLRNARINFRQYEQTHLMENAIYNELRLRGYNVDVGVVPTAEKDKSGKVTRKKLEVDFVCNLASARYYIQSALSIPDESKRLQEIRSFRKIDNSFKKIIITKDIIPPQYDEYGILTLNIYDFLLDPAGIKVSG